METWIVIVMAFASGLAMGVLIGYASALGDYIAGASEDPEGRGS